MRMNQKRLSLAVVVLGLALPGMASAQGMGMGTPTGPVVPTAKPEKPKAPEPPALPGSRPGADVVAPSDKLATDMAPNEALFDAINRGDLAGARDAINRGADLHAQNILGLTRPSCRSISAATASPSCCFRCAAHRPATSRRRPRRLLRPSRPANAASVAARRSPPLRSHSTQPPFRPPTWLRRVRPGRAGRSAKPPSPATRPPPSRRQRRQLRRRVSSPVTAALRFRRWDSSGSAASRGEPDGRRLDTSHRA